MSRIFYPVVKPASQPPTNPIISLCLMLLATLVVRYSRSDDSLMSEQNTTTIQNNIFQREYFMKHNTTQELSKIGNISSSESTPILGNNFQQVQFLKYNTTLEPTYLVNMSSSHSTISPGCKSTIQGSDYTGNLSHTSSGLQCEMWIKTYYNTSELFPDKNISMVKNFCRNPVNDLVGPWCITTDPDIRWQYCDIPLCDPTLVYTGFKSITVYGLECQKWSLQSPHQHKVGVNDWEFPGEDVESVNNFCRNPNNNPKGPWCYTTHAKHRSQYCFIPGYTNITLLWDMSNNKYYTGTVSTTIGGHACQKWSHQHPHTH